MKDDETRVLDGLTSQHAPVNVHEENPTVPWKFDYSELNHGVESRSHTDSAKKAPLALLAAMPTTKDYQPLPNPTREINTVASILSSSYIVSSFSSLALTRRNTIEGLWTRAIARLPCHGSVDPQDPLKSKLLLDDWKLRVYRVNIV